MCVYSVSGPLVVGYNHIGFDYPVISGYFQKGKERDNALNQLKSAANFDLLIDIRELIGKRIKLDSVARATLNTGKSADGLLALDHDPDDAANVFALQVSFDHKHAI